MFDPLGYSNLLLPIGQAEKDCTKDLNVCDCGCMSGRTVTVTYHDKDGESHTSSQHCPVAEQ